MNGDPGTPFAELRDTAALDEIRDAVRRCDETLDAIAEVPVADTRAAQIALMTIRLGTIEQALDRIREAL